MTYDQLIQKIWLRSQRFLNGDAENEAGTIYDALNDALREISNLTRDKQSSASLSVISGTADYALTAIASDVGEIALVVYSHGAIEPLYIRPFEKSILDDIGNNPTQSNSVGTPVNFRVWNDSLRFYPTPDANITVTVYYTVNIPTAYYVKPNATAVPLNDTYLMAVVYETIAILAENKNELKQAEYYRDMSREKIVKAMETKVFYDTGSTIKYHDALSS
jgi:hypothetical protein